MGTKNELAGDVSFLSNLVKGEVIQETAPGVVTTKGYKSGALYLDAPNSKDTRFHYPSYGRVNDK